MTEHPLIAEHRRRFGVSHTSLGRNLRGNRVGRRKTADNDPIKQSGEDGPISHEEQEKRLADTKMWVPHRAFEPASIARQGASGFASKIGLADPHEHSYSGIRTSTDDLREIGRAYDRLPVRDSSAIPHFERMRDEIRNQHDHLTNTMGIKTEVVDHDPYPTVHHMVKDLVDNKRIKVLGTKVTGGHDFLSDEDNDKFRAIHDVFGHAATGRGFDAHGEEAAWLAHSRMFTPHARGAMSSETRGQNSALHINGTFQAQKTALLPRHMWDDTAVSKHLSSISPRRNMSFPHDQYTRAQPKEWQDGAEKGWEDAKDGYLEFENPHADRWGGGKGYGAGWDHAVGLYNEPDDYDYWSHHKNEDPEMKTSARGPLSFEAFVSVATGHILHNDGSGNTLCGADLSQQKPNQPGFERTCSTCRDRMEEGVSYRAKSDMAPYTLKDVTGTRKVAHDSGDGETIYHCPFCGSGQVIARSDRTIECEFCHTCFTVQVQPQYAAFPQTVNGMPVQVPGMPGQMGVDPAAGGMPPGADPNADPNADPDADGNPFASGGDDDSGEQDDSDDDDKGGNPFAKASTLRTQAGKALSVDAYLAHLALRHTEDRDATLAAIRSRRG